jgi:hypothetical protein
MKNMKNLYIAAIVVAVTLAVTIPIYSYTIATSNSASGDIVQNHWKSTAFPITWQMNPVQGPNVTGTRTQADVFLASFKTWQDLTTASISFTRGADTAPTVRQGIDGINVVTTNTLPGDLPTGVLALTGTVVFSQTGVDSLGRTIDFPGQIVEADIYFSSVVPFTTNTTALPGAVDLQSVATHEIGHFLGLDHSALISATMFWTVGSGFVYPRTLSADDIAAVSTLYPAASFASKGSISGTIRTTANAAVYGAVVVAVNANGTPVASAITDPTGAYTIAGLDAGSYTVYAEPLDGPITINNITSLLRVYPSATPNTSFATRFR